MQLDEIDYRILSALRKDGRRPLRELARLANVSIPTVRVRIMRLKTLGVIKRFTVVVDTSGLVDSVTAFLALKARISDMRSTVEAIGGICEVSDVYLTTGQYDIVVKVTVPNMQSMEGFIEKIGSIHGLELINSSFVIDAVKEQFGSPLRPGLGFRVRCGYCGKDISSEAVQRVEDEYERYFCSQGCASTFEERMKSSG